MCMTAEAWSIMRLDNRIPTMKTLLVKTVIVLAALFILFTLVAALTYSPKDKAMSDDRIGIKVCWDGQSKKSLTPEQARFIASACEEMETKFRAKYGVTP